jgi:hypothetical protein
MRVLSDLGRGLESGLVTTTLHPRRPGSVTSGMEEESRMKKLEVFDEAGRLVGFAVRTPWKWRNHSLGDWWMAYVPDEDEVWHNLGRSQVVGDGIRPTAIA